jgi:hypothetical protein
MYVLTDSKTVIKFPYSFAELRKANPATSFPSSFSDKELAQWGVFPVLEKAPPTCDPATEEVKQVNPTLVSGKWTQTWSVTKVSPEDAEQRLKQQSAEMRYERNQRLTASDWTQLADAPVDAALWSSYRQELRDVTKQSGFPWAVQWPSAPEA